MQMKTDYQKIYRLAKPHLGTRCNDVHTEISIQFAYKLLTAEGGDETIVIPAVILHDVGWEKVPEEFHLKAFGPAATVPELNRLHEVEGVKIARGILEKVNYADEDKARILEIIDGHDSREKSVSLNDQIVKDADKLWRYSKQGLHIDSERFGESHTEGLNRLRKYLPVWFYTRTARKLAGNELKKREKESEQ
jgi:HD superfamily phosphodiesterase